MFRTFLFLSLIALLPSCINQKKLSATAPVSALPPLAQSRISIPVKIYAKPFLQNLQERIPAEYVSTGWPEFLATGCDFKYKYRFITSALRFTCVNNLVSVTMSGSYQIAGSKSLCAFGKQISPWLNGSCGFSPEMMRRIEVSLQSQISFQPDYSMRTLSRISAVTPIDRCRMTILGTDVTGMITDQIRSAIANVTTSTSRSSALKPCVSSNLPKSSLSITTATGTMESRFGLKRSRWPMADGREEVDDWQLADKRKKIYPNHHSGNSLIPNPGSDLFLQILKIL